MLEVPGEFFNGEDGEFFNDEDSEFFEDKLVWKHGTWMTPRRRLMSTPRHPTMIMAAASVVSQDKEGYESTCQGCTSMAMLFKQLTGSIQIRCHLCSLCGDEPQMDSQEQFLPVPLVEILPFHIDVNGGMWQICC